MQKKRIFIAINLPERIKEKLSGYRCELPAKWTKKENLHITLEFVGYIEDEELLEVLERTKELASRMPVFTLKLDKITYFPNKNKPKYIFATGGKYHVTLARIKQWQLRQMDLEDWPEIEKDIDLEFQVNSIEVMESVLKREGPEYTILQSYNLK